MSPRQSAANPRRAFTLVELVVVVLILALLAGVAAFAYGQVTESSHKNAARAAAEQFARDARGVAAAQRAGVGALRITNDSAIDQVVSDASGAHAAVDFGQVANGAVVAGVSAYGWCTPVLFLADADAAPQLGQTTKATACKTDTGALPDEGTSTGDAGGTGGDGGTPVVDVSWTLDVSGACALDNQALLCWGDNAYGPVGDGTTVTKTRPTPVSGGGAWASVSRARSTTCGIKTDGTGWCWGRNDFGQLGDGTKVDKSVPTPVSGGGTWSTIRVGGYTTCGIRTDGTGWCWGSNGYGNVGDGTNVDKTVPTQVPGTWSSLTAGETGNLSTVTCGVKTDGTGWCWGYNSYAQIGNGTTTNSRVPVQLPGVWKSLSIGFFSSCGVRTDGTGWCWGKNSNGEVGDGTLVQKASPVQLPGTNWSWLHVLADGTCGLQTDGSAWCWGANNYGQLGDGTTLQRNSPVKVLGAGAWASLSPGGNSVCGLKVDQTAWCWGNGNLGGGASAQSSTPVGVAGTWTSIAMHDRGYFSCGTKVDHTTWCWGPNASGQVGDGTTTDRWSPTQVQTH